MRNKKSQVEDLLEFMFIMVVVVIVVLLFSLRGVSYAKTTNEQVKIATLAEDSDKLFITYFRIPIDNKNEIIADLLNKYFITSDENTLKQLNSFTDNFFSKTILETDTTSWSLEIKPSGKNSLLIQSEKSKTRFFLRKEISKMILPSFQSSTVEVKLFITSPEENLLI